MQNRTPAPRGAFVTAAAIVFLIPFSTQGQANNAVSRITAAIDEARLTTLDGNTHPLARPQFDRGSAPASLQMERMLLVLTRSPQQEAALETLLEQQQDASSPNFHRWLTPQQFGQQFGPSDQDIQTITSWLQSHEFQVSGFSNGRTVIEFSGTAAQVQEAFHTTIHQYVVSGEQHWANSSDPQIPAALAPVVAGISTLYNFPRKQLHELVGNLQSDVAIRVGRAGPNFTFTCGTDNMGQPVSCFAVAPADFAKIYNVPNLLLSPAPATQFNGDGVTIAIVGESDIDTNDVAQFRSVFGLPALKAQQLNVVVNGPDPGVNGAETEADLDVETVSGVAPNATIDLVLAEPTEVSLGVDLAAQYVVDSNLAAIINESFGVCEFFMGTTNNAFYNGLWQQAAAQGISVFVSTGDAGSAVCDGNVGSNGPAQLGLSVSGISSTPYNVGVGGTDFNDATNPLTYWNSANNSTTLASAKSYIPEVPWNNTCTNPEIPSLLGLPKSTTAEQMCNNTSATNQFPFLLEPVGGSGGKSGCTVSDFSPPLFGSGNLSSCSGGYAKPSWQTKLTPADSKRDLPDVSFFAANGLNGNFYVICEADIPGQFSLGPCGTSQLVGLGGTSASSPAFAAIMALINQATGSRQGNPNPILYKLAAQSGNTCNSAANPASTCMFYDAPSGFTIAMPCATGSTSDCVTKTAGDSVGVLSGYATASGYDLATGLGSVNANNLITNWKNFSLTPSTTALTLTPPAGGTLSNLKHGQSVSVSINVTGTGGTPSGNASLIANTGPNGTEGVQGFVLNNSGVASGNTASLPGGSYTVIAQYSGDGTFGSSASAPPVNVTVAPEASKMSIAYELFNPNTGTVTNAKTTTATFGTPSFLRVNVTSQASDACPNNAPGDSGCPTGNVSITDAYNGGAAAPLDGGSFALNSQGYTEDQTIDLPGGTHLITATYAGDNSFTKPASPATETLTITPVATTTNMSASTNSTTVGASVTLFANMSASNVFSNHAPTGTVKFFSGNTQVGSATLSGNTSISTGQANGFASTATTSLPFGQNSVTAQYSGDNSYATSSSTATTIMVLYGTTMSLNANPNNVIYGQGTNVTVTAMVSTGQSASNVALKPAGTVSFNGCGQVSGSVTTNTGQDASGNWTLQATVTTTPQQSEVICASYSGDSNYAVSSQNVFVTVTIPDFSISSNPTSIAVTAGQTGTATLTIAPMTNYASTVSLSCYNFTNQRNWQPSPSIYGNDFLVQNDPRSFEVRLEAKF